MWDIKKKSDFALKISRWVLNENELEQDQNECRRPDGRLGQESVGSEAAWSWVTQAEMQGSNLRDI